MPRLPLQPLMRTATAAAPSPNNVVCVRNSMYGSKITLTVKLQLRDLLGAVGGDRTAAGSPSAVLEVDLYKTLGTVPAGLKASCVAVPGG